MYHQVTSVNVSPASNISYERVRLSHSRLLLLAVDSGLAFLGGSTCAGFGLLPAPAVFPVHSARSRPRSSRTIYSTRGPFVSHARVCPHVLLPRRMAARPLPCLTTSLPILPPACLSGCAFAGRLCVPGNRPARLQSAFAVLRCVVCQSTYLPTRPLVCSSANPARLLVHSPVYALSYPSPRLPFCLPARSRAHFPSAYAFAGRVCVLGISPARSQLSCVSSLAHSFFRRSSPPALPLASLALTRSFVGSICVLGISPARLRSACVLSPARSPSRWSSTLPPGRPVVRCPSVGRACTALGTRGRRADSAAHRCCILSLPLEIARVYVHSPEVGNRPRALCALCATAQWPVPAHSPTLLHARLATSCVCAVRSSCFLASATGRAGCCERAVSPSTLRTPKFRA